MENSSKKNQKNAINPMWGGLIESNNDDLLKDINQSISFDYILYREDIKGSIAHAKMLARQNIITQKESQQIIVALEEIRNEISQGHIDFDKNLEDIHMNIEFILRSKIGDVAGKLHTARSRNDQVATDSRLWLREQTHRMIKQLEDMRRNILKRAEEHYDTAMPGFTHLQTAQPVTFGHHLMAYYEMFTRDQERLVDSVKRCNQSPLGAAALAGSTYAIDRHDTAKELGFDMPMKNSMDAVSSRDFMLEFLSVISIHAIHMSRLAEEMVLFSSKQFSFIHFSDAFSTGSSIMPQKRNPDAAELIRAKPARIIGALQSLLMMLKALPLTYSKDMQEDKEMLFDAVKNMHMMQCTMAGLILDMSIDKENMLEALEFGFPTATDVADWLVKNTGISFREAHHITGKIVSLATKKNCFLRHLPLEELQEFHENITDDIYQYMSISKSLHDRSSYGGTAPSCVKRAIEEAKKEMGTI